ncbi:MAG: IPT/TIG domain-containing protein, partial [Vicinamibacterales bacterium]
MNSIDPANGTATGGTTITIIGANFVTGASVTIGGSAATNVTVVNSTRITATTPAHAAGVVDVVARNADNQFGTLVGGFTYVACGDGCHGDTVSGDFSAGTHNGTTTTETIDGEVTLAPEAGSEFSGSALPSGWSASPWSAGGTATVANGVVSVDAALLATDASFGSNRVLEFVGIFATGVPFQHVGLGTDLNSTPWAIFSTGGDGTSLRARTDGPSGSAATDLGSSSLGTAHRYRIEWTPTQVVYSINGTVVATHAVAISQSMRPVVSDGAVAGGSLVIDWMRLGPYSATGTFLSRVYDGGNNATTWTAIHWTADAPTGAGLTVSVRAGGTPVPDATWSAFTTVAGSGAPINLAGRYLQYRVELTTTNPQITPVFRNVTLGYVVAVSPTVTAVTPATGTADGGTAVTIDGTNFAVGASVTIGGTAATNVTVVNGTRITATTPAHAAGAVDVVVTNQNGSSGTLANGYTYVVLPSVTGLSPSSGTTAGGTTVTINGGGFTGATGVTFGGTAATFTVVNATTITATTPARPAGTVDVIVTTPGGSSTATTASRFAYVVSSMAL